MKFSIIIEKRLHFAIGLITTLCLFSCSKPSGLILYPHHWSGEMMSVTDEVQDFIPKEYSLLSHAEGQLNREGEKDIVIILKHDAEKSDTSDYETVRPLIILQRKNGKLYEAARCDKAVYCKSCGGVLGDPFEHIKTELGKVIVYHYGGSNWRWDISIMISYSEKEDDWFIGEIKTQSFHVSNPDKIETSILNAGQLGLLRLSEFDIYKY